MILVAEKFICFCEAKIKGVFLAGIHGVALQPWEIKQKGKENVTLSKFERKM